MFQPATMLGNEIMRYVMRGLSNIASTFFIARCSVPSGFFFINMLYNSMNHVIECLFCDFVVFIFSMFHLFLSRAPFSSVTYRANSFVCSTSDSFCRSTGRHSGLSARCYFDEHSILSFIFSDDERI